MLLYEHTRNNVSMFHVILCHCDLWTWNCGRLQRSHTFGWTSSGWTQSGACQQPRGVYSTSFLALSAFRTSRRRASTFWFWLSISSSLSRSWRTRRCFADLWTRKTSSVGVLFTDGTLLKALLKKLQQSTCFYLRSVSFSFSSENSCMASFLWLWASFSSLDWDFNFSLASTRSWTRHRRQQSWAFQIQ